MAKRRMKFFRGGAVHGLVPVAAGSVLTGGATLAIRSFVTPTPGTPSEAVYKWAPAIGIGAGLVGSALLYFLGGKRAGRDAAMISATVALLSGGLLLGSERLNVARPGGMLALASGGSAAESAGMPGLSALMPEYATPQGAGPLGAIVMEPLRGAFGEDVNVSGLGAGFRQEAFGKRAY